MNEIHFDSNVSSHKLNGAHWQRSTRNNASAKTSVQVESPYVSQSHHDKDPEVQRLVQMMNNLPEPSNENDSTLLAKVNSGEYLSRETAEQTAIAFLGFMTAK